jgi:hypothetical protein
MLYTIFMCQIRHFYIFFPQIPLKLFTKRKFDWGLLLKGPLIFWYFSIFFLFSFLLILISFSNGYFFKKIILRLFWEEK